MKYLSRFIILLSLLTLFPVVHADFFEESVLGTSVEATLIDQIVLKEYTFRSAAENTRYTNTLKFVAGVKDEAKRRFQDGTIPFYRQYDIIHDLDALVYSMNEYFFFKRQYERTNIAAYKEFAIGYLSDARWDYIRLKDTLKQSAK